MKSAQMRPPALATDVFRRIALAAALLASVQLHPAPVKAQVSDLVSHSAFRVCADPANYPFSHRDKGGFEMEIAELLAAELDRPVQYFWFPMATGFVRKTLSENRCDVIIGFAQGHELVLNTNHYYTSAFVLVTKPDSPLAAVETLGDPALQGKRIGIIAGSPPGNQLARYGLIARAKPYNLMVDRRHESPNEDMIADLVSGEIDAAIMWGPIGGNLAMQQDPPMTVTPLLREEFPPKLFYRITMGVRQGELVWKRQLNSLIRKTQPEIDAILTRWGVPLIDDMGTGLKTVSQ